MSEENKKKSKKAIIFTICIVIAAALSVFLVSTLVTGNSSNNNKNALDNNNTTESPSSTESNTAPANGPIEEKNGLTLNLYVGHGLDGSSYGTEEIFSTMKSSTLPTYGECFIVAVNNEITGEVIKIFSATGYELKMAFAGNSLDDVLEKFDIN